ncbi:transcriptional regulator LysR family [Vibrio variabilis]|uniref:Transcriptional regulator LysR family n=1 Tax=Vibrio variabilis TaxID=990271 RepID=A0ABQ0JIW0_9VIBR|nr:transcriptional regulator LysR family [Vibrio variabilis]
MLSLEQLTVFKAAAELGSFSAAARDTGKAVSTVSNSISNLEVHLGIPLFDRSTRIPTLTPQGEQLFAKTQVLFQQLDGIEHIAQDSFAEMESHIHIGVDELIPSQLYEVPIERVTRDYPNVKVTLTRGTSKVLQQLLLDGDVDLAMAVTGEKLDYRLSVKGCDKVTFVLACSPDHPFADQEIVTDKEMYQNRQITCSAMNKNPQLASVFSFSPDIWSASSQEDVIRLVEQGMGWALVPKAMADERSLLGSLTEFHSDMVNVEIAFPAELFWVSERKCGPIMTRLQQELSQQTK